MFLSIIIPVYNAKAFIVQCIDSLINQDIPAEDYEIICIDDGSTDETPVMLESYRKKYSNVIVKRKENGGVSAARNEGISIAKGDYVWFVDADDFIAPDILNKLKTLAESKNPERITVESYSFDTELKTAQIKDLKPNVPYKKVMATRTLYKLDYLKSNDIQFVKGVHYGEDGLFNYQTLIHNPKTVNSGVLAYFYRVHNASVTNAPKKQRVKKSLEGSKLVLDILVRDYNSGICPEESRRMLLYWMYAVAEHYTILGQEYFSENFRWEYEINNIPSGDSELRKMDGMMRRVSKNRNYGELVSFTEKKARKDSKAITRQKNKKIIKGYIKHPKRLLRKLMGK